MTTFVLRDQMTSIVPSADRCFNDTPESSSVEVSTSLVSLGVDLSLGRVLVSRFFRRFEGEGSAAMGRSIGSRRVGVAGAAFDEELLAAAKMATRGGGVRPKLTLFLMVPAGFGVVLLLWLAFTLLTTLVFLEVSLKGKQLSTARDGRNWR